MAEHVETSAKMCKIALTPTYCCRQTQLRSFLKIAASRGQMQQQSEILKHMQNVCFCLINCVFNVRPSDFAVYLRSDMSRCTNNDT